jgi:hypothetical protein
MMIALLLATLSVSQAGVLTTYGGGEIGSAGGAGATVRSPLSAWHNPAAMRTPRIEQSLEWLYGAHRFTENGKELQVTDDANGIILGAVVGGYWFRVPAVNIGIATYMPLSGPYAWTEDPATAEHTRPTTQVPRFADELDRLEVALASNVWITDWLSVGFGVDASAEIETLTIAAVEDIEKPEDSKKAQDIRITPTFHPYAGLLVVTGAPGEPGLRLGLVARSAREMHDYGRSNVKLFELDVLYRHEYIRHQAPRSVTLGTALVCPAGFELRADSTYAAWSEIVGPYGEDVGDSYGDTMNLRLGLVRAWEDTSIQIGHAIDPSPLRQVPAGTAYLDAPSRTWTAGLSRVLVRPGRRVLRLLLGIQRTRFQPRTPADPSGATRTLDGSLTAGRIGIELGHRGAPKGALWSKSR